MKRAGWSMWGAALCLVLAGCAMQTHTPPTAHYAVGRAQIGVPAGDWQDLGAADGAWRSLPGEAAKVALRSRALVLRGPQREPLAVVLVRTNASNLFWKPVAWGVACPRELDVLMRDGAAGSPVRMDCLRLRRDAGAQRWLERTRPVAHAWLAGQQLLPNQPYSHLSYRFATEDGGLAEVQILASQPLLQTTSAGKARQQRQWAMAVASAVRDSLSSLDGELRLPAFPGAIP